MTSFCDCKAKTCLDEMIEIASAVPRREISVAQIEAWAGSLRNHDFYNKVGLLVARSYAAGTTNFWTSDGIINDLWRAWLEGSENGAMVPCPFYDIFEAFDAGEYHRSPGRTDDPIKEHTDPMITEILSRPAHPMT